MKNWRLILIVCISSCLTGLLVQTLHGDVGLSVTPELSPEQLRSDAKSITVKVFSGETWGSGILVRRQGRIYTVLTNDHVLISVDRKPYRIQTPDGRIYPATVSTAAKFDGNDLGLLEFRSIAADYEVALLGASSMLAGGDEVFASGFPFDAKGFVFTTGQVKLLLDKPFKGGYQIGYTNDIQKGMSGGPVLNRQGFVIGINGRHSYPPWGNPYVFKDGSVPNQAMRKQMIQLSWAVPMQSYLQMTPLVAVSCQLFINQSCDLTKKLHYSFGVFNPTKFWS